MFYIAAFIGPDVYFLGYDEKYEVLFWSKERCPIGTVVLETIEQANAWIWALQKDPTLKTATLITVGTNEPMAYEGQKEAA